MRRRNSSEVFNQILWDDRLDAARFSLHIDVHTARPSVVAMPDFDPEGDIPWHRVLAILADDTVCWDRQGCDTVGQLARSGRFVPRSLRPPLWDARAPVRFEEGGWRASVDVVEEREQLTLLTWNVLWDRFHPEQIHSALRWPRLIEEVLASGADLIALQEVTPRFHRLLCAHPEVRARYWVSHAPGHSDIGASDVLMLGTVPIRELGWCNLRPHKAALGAVLAAGPLVITTHLSSDHSKNAAQRRTEELQRIQLASEGLSSIWLGDFNTTAEPLLDTRDAWSALKESEPTFDPVRNPLAVHSSKTGRPVRIDRVLLRGPFRPVFAERIGLVATDGLHPSDHFGVKARLSLTGASAWLGEPSHRSALAFLPKDTEALQRVRADRDPAFDTWPAHLNLLWPFVPEHAFDEAESLLDALAESGQIRPFDADLSVRARFPGRRPVAHLAPADPAPWKDLQRRLLQIFPTCGTGDPHLTVARDSDPLPELEVQEEVGALALLTKRGDQGTYEVRSVWHFEAGVERVQTAEFLGHAAPLVLPEGFVCVGSRALGAALDGADADLLYRGDLDEAGEAARVWGEPRKVSKRGHEGWVIEEGACRLDILPEAAGAGAVEDVEALLPADVELLRWVKAWARAQRLDQAAFGGVEGLAWAVLVHHTGAEGGLRERLARFFARWATHDWDEGVGCDPTHPVSIGTPSDRRTITTRARRGPLEAALWRAWEQLDAGIALEKLRIPPPWHRNHAEALWIRPGSAEEAGWVRGRALWLIETLNAAPYTVEDTLALGLPKQPGDEDADAAVDAWAPPGLSVRRVWSWEVP